MATVNVIRRAASWRDLEPGTVFMFESDLIAAQQGHREPWRYCRMIVDLDFCKRGWVSFFTGNVFEWDPLTVGDALVIAEPIE